MKKSNGNQQNKKTENQKPRSRNTSKGNTVPNDNGNGSVNEMKIDNHIENADQLKAALGVKSLESLKEPEVFDRFLQIQKDHKIEYELLKETILQVPKLFETFRDILQNSTEILDKLNERDKQRWMAFKFIAKTNTLTPEQVIEVMNLILEAGKKDENVFKEILYFLISAGSLVVIVIAWILSGGRGFGESNENLGNSIS